MRRNVGPGFDTSPNAPPASELASSFQLYYEAERRAAKRSQRNVDQRAARVRELVDFFQSPQTRTAPLPMMVSFLAMRGFGRTEMEEALSMCENRAAEYGILLSWIPGTELTSVEGPKESLLFDQHYNNKSAAASPESTMRHYNSADGDPASLGATVNSKTATTTNRVDPLASTNPAALAATHWRIGGTVFAYLGNMRYCPVPLEAVDLTRNGDILGVDTDNMRRFDPAVRRTLANPAAPLCCQGTRNLTHFAPGFKGIATNQCAVADIVHEGMQLLVADPDCEMGTFREATVLAVHIDENTVTDDPSLAASATFDTLEVDSSDDDKQTSFTIDIEWSHNAKVLRGVKSDDTRLFTHADVLRAEMRHRREQLRAARKGQKFSVDKASSAANFPVSGAQLLDEQGERASGHALRAIKLHRQARDKLGGSSFGANPSSMGGSSVLPEHMHRGFVKNFVRYPELADTDAEPVHCRTATEFISHFGEAKAGTEPDSKRRRFPIQPESQRTMSGVGFGFDTSCYPRHSRSNVHLLLNPIVDVAFQCMQRNSKFVDPDFPPSFKSLFGVTGAAHLPQHLPPMFGRSGASGSDAAAAAQQVENEVMWRRLSDIFFRPRMHVVDSSPAHLKLGAFTPPWLECVVLSLNRNQDLVEELISPGEDGWVFGAYVVRLLVEGAWHYVLVDDFVPCHPKSGQPLCFLSGKESEIYTAVIEKALAKVEGSYAGLYLSLRPEVTPGRIWNDISGFVHDVIEHDCVTDKDNICENLLGLVNEEAVDVAPLHVQARAYGDELTHLCRFGFERDSWWHVDSAVRFWDPPNDSVYFFRVYRGENTGYPVNAATLQAAVFDGIDTAVLDELPAVPCDSSVSFWIDGTRFFDVFERTVVLREMRNSHKATFEGTFAGRPHAGPVSQGPKFFLNPQLFLSVVQPADMIFNLELRDRRLLGGPGDPEPLPKEINGEAMQLYILHTHPVEEAITAEAAKADPQLYRAMAFSQPARVSDDEDVRAYPVVTLRASLPGGCFVIIPTMGVPSHEEFTLNVFSTASFQLSRLN